MGSAENSLRRMFVSSGDIEVTLTGDLKMNHSEPTEKQLKQ